jgi:hypothetical protein
VGQDQITVLNGAEIIAEHVRSYDKGQQIEEESHISALTKIKKQARLHRGQNRLVNAAPSSSALLVQAAGRGYKLSAITAHLIQLLDSYGAVELEAAI